MKDKELVKPLKITTMNELKELQEWLRGEIKNYELFTKEAQKEELYETTKIWMIKHDILKRVLYETHLIIKNHEQR